jgi:hypothetical protein
VRDLLLGSDLQFIDQGERTLSQRLRVVPTLVQPGRSARLIFHLNVAATAPPTFSTVHITQLPSGTASCPSHPIRELLAGDAHPRPLFLLNPRARNVQTEPRRIGSLLAHRSARRPCGVAAQLSVRSRHPRPARDDR